MARKAESERIDIYTRITDRIVEDLESGVRPWMKPWNGANANGRITRPVRSKPFRSCPRTSATGRDRRGSE